VRVLLAIDTIGGVWTYGLELTRALARHGIEVVLAGLGNPLNPEQRRAALESSAARVYAFECELEWMEHPWGDVERSGEWLLEVAAETDANLVHLNTFAHGGLPWPVPVVVGAHSDVLTWHEAVRSKPAGAEWDEYREAVSGGLLGADAVVAPTEAMLRDLERNYRFPCERRAIPNARDPKLFVPLEKEPFVFSAGRLWDEAKNIAALDRIAQRLPWPVVLAGPGVPGASRRLGSVSGPQLADLFGRASIFAEPARYEPFGLAALEAGLAGCALVLGDIESLREVWADAAVFVKEDSLERELRRLINDPGLRRDLGARARRRALEYTPERMGAEYAGLYEQLLSEDPADLHAIKQVA